jgi:ribosomal protein L36
MFKLKNFRRSLEDFKFCENQKVIKRKLATLIICEHQDEELDGEIFIDIESNQKWVLYEHDDFDAFREPYPKGLRIYPHLSLNEIIEVVCTSKYDDEIIGACRLLLENECQEFEFREQLLNEIELRNIHNNKSSYQLIFEAAKLGDQSNKREVLNKNVNEVKDDYIYFIELSDRAQKLKY